MILSGDLNPIVKKLRDCGLYIEAVLNFNVDHQSAKELIKNSSVLVIPRPNLKLLEYAYPSKLPEDLSTGISLILTKVGPVEELLRGYNCAIVIEPNNLVKNLEEALVRVYRMSLQEKIELGSRAINFIKTNLTWDILGEKINQSLSKL